MIYFAIIMVIVLIRLLSQYAKNENKHTLKYYKNEYQDIIKNSFSDNKKNLLTLLRALRFYNEDKYRHASILLCSLLSKCKTENERYSVNLFLALVNSDFGNTENAILIYENMVDIGIADSRVFSNMLILYKDKGDYEKAYNAGLRAIEASPGNSNAYNNFAYFLFSDGNYEEAKNYAKKCLSIKNNAIESITLLYIIYTLEENEEEAEVYRKKAIANGRSQKELKEIIESYVGKEEE